MSNENIRRYWRRAKERQRAAKAAKASRRFTPRIIRFERCSLCESWHPALAILSTGHIVRFTLDSYHRQESIKEFVDNIQCRMKAEAATQKPEVMELAIAELLESHDYSENPEYTEKDARLEARALLKNDGYREHLVQFHEDQERLQVINHTGLEICIRSRMELFKENRDIAESNCKIVLADPLYRHFPPGLVRDPEGRYDLSGAVLVPVEIDDDPTKTKDPDMSALGKCFTEKMQEGGEMTPQDAVLECIHELRLKKGIDALKEPKRAIPDIYGKTKKEVLAMRKPTEDPNFTVGDVFGKTQKQILEEQKRRRQRAKDN